MPEDLRHFRVSAGLKDVIGRELITDDIIAVFELVKNSFDAHSTEVEIEFLRNRKPEEAKLIIKDNGKGMTQEDLRDKWLWVAYSAKREGTEDEELQSSPDYRELIGKDRPFAGAKGIGRFSCDRLGAYLRIFTRRGGADAAIECIEVEWAQFERDAKERFEDVEVKHTTPAKIPYPLRQGTVLEITGLRSQWSREALRRLRTEMQKLINPGIGAEERPFRVVLKVPDEEDADLREREMRDRINGEIKNIVFETLGIKTTRIVCRVSASGKTIETVLEDRGTAIYRLVERNAAFDQLADVRITLFYLNRAAKGAFKKSMGLEPVKYGSVFLYKNGFRVQPYGRQGDDGYGLDRRKQQGTRRYLGTRDLIGRIEITADKAHFKEASSRDNGLVESPERVQLFEFFLEIALRRLENYVVEVIEWGNSPKGSEEEVSPADVRPRILGLLTKLTDSAEVEGCEYNPDLLQIVTERQAKGVSGLLENFHRIAKEHGDEPLRQEAARLERQVNQVLTDRAEAQAKAHKEHQTRVLTEQQLELERKRNVYLKGMVGTPEEHRISLTHWIMHSVPAIEGGLTGLLQKLAKGDVDNSEITESLARVLRQCQALRKVSALVTKANFNLKVDSLKQDLSRFFLEYLSSEECQQHGLNIQVSTDEKPSVRWFSPIEMAILIDNFMSNATKAGASEVRVELRSADERLLVSIANDGRAVPDRVRESLFDLGVSTTGGTGVGLFTCRQIVDGMNGEIEYIGSDRLMGGAVFEMRFPL